MIRAIVIDDEQPSVDKLGKLLSDSGLVEVAGKFTEPLEAMAYIQGSGVDAVFLDIEMPDVNGLELANHILDMQQNIAVVFVTAYHQYAVEAFRVNALDYLLKPVSSDRLMETLRRILQQNGLQRQPWKLKVQCFGKFRVTLGPNEIRFRTEKAEELLAYLIDQRGNYISRSRIIDSLWEDFEADRAIVHFNTTLHYVKKALNTYGAELTIQHDRGSYRLDVDGLDCDYLKFSSFTDFREAEASISRSEYIAGLYSGEYLSGCDYTWVTGKRLLLEEQFISLLLDIAEHYKSAEMYPAAIQWLKKGLIHESLHRELNYRLIEALWISHERALAVKHYQSYRDGLMKKLQQEPDAAFKKLLGS